MFSGKYSRISYDAATDTRFCTGRIVRINISAIKCIGTKIIIGIISNEGNAKLVIMVFGHDSAFIRIKKFKCTNRSNLNIKHIIQLII